MNRDGPRLFLEWPIAVTILGLVGCTQGRALDSTLLRALDDDPIVRESHVQLLFESRDGLGKKWRQGQIVKYNALKAKADWSRDDLREMLLVAQGACHHLFFPGGQVCVGDAALGLVAERLRDGAIHPGWVNAAIESTQDITYLRRWIARAQSLRMPELTASLVRTWNELASTKREFRSLHGLIPDLDSEDVQWGLVRCLASVASLVLEEERKTSAVLEKHSKTTLSLKTVGEVLDSIKRRLMDQGVAMILLTDEFERGEIVDLTLSGEMSVSQVFSSIGPTRNIALAPFGASVLVADVDRLEAMKGVLVAWEWGRTKDESLGMAAKALVRRIYTGSLNHDSQAAIRKELLSSRWDPLALKLEPIE